jgi:hypothetical protein
MKKFFAIAFIAASLVACGGGETKPTTNEDSLKAAATADSLKAAADTAVKAAMDTATAKIDSAVKDVKAAIDSVKK